MQKVEFIIDSYSANSAKGSGHISRTPFQHTLVVWEAYGKLARGCITGGLQESQCGCPTIGNTVSKMQGLINFNICKIDT